MANKTTRIFGFEKRVNEAIADSGMSKRQIALKMDRNKAFFYKSNYSWNAGTLMKFCAVTGASADWLLGLTEVKKRE